MEKDSKTMQIAFGFTLLSALRSELMKRGFSTFPLLYVQGMQNYGKTVLVTQQCLLYDRKDRSKLPTLKRFLKATPWGELSKNAIGDRLEQEKAIPPIENCKEKRRAKKRIHSERYLEIPLDMLAKAAMSYE